MPRFRFQGVAQFTVEGDSLQGCAIALAERVLGAGCLSERVISAGGVELIGTLGFSHGRYTCRVWREVVTGGARPRFVGEFERGANGEVLWSS